LKFCSKIQIVFKNLNFVKNSKFSSKIILVAKSASKIKILETKLNIWQSTARLGLRKIQI